MQLRLSLSVNADILSCQKYKLILKIKCNVDAIGFRNIDYTRIQNLNTDSGFKNYFSNDNLNEIT